MMSDVKSIKITKTIQSKLQDLDASNLKFGKSFTDHMLVCDFENGEWGDPQILPYQNISIDPSTSFIHYGQSIFEGLKAHKGQNGEILLFRPMANFERLNNSAERMCMAQLPEWVYEEGLKSIIDLDRDWIPDDENGALYIRPFMFGTEAFLGVKASASYRFMIILSPVGAYYSHPVKVKIEKYYSRAMEGGVGAAKTSGNYAASIYPAKKGMEEGYDQLIWTDAKNHEKIEESGTMNIMFVLDGKLITPKLGTSILPGITRDSILTIARDWGVETEERDVYVKEIIEGIESGKLSEAFGVGTAATIAHIETIGHDCIDYHLPSVESRSFSNKLSAYLNDYKRGRVEDRFGWLTEV
ncbi:MAG: branched chain amino acid aminotransferase [Crocinitomicaceae bacterium]|nr:branched chain amino acid aminotransferase [Crocinitomicaceae bacterium]|tara:strand:- start:10126 stop:11193 length:1068 start_codon:yes stop_codon:yes gene_type:complete